MTEQIPQVTHHTPDTGSTGPGFAIPVNTVKADLPTLRAGSMN
ncbi:hypothetical protein [Streptomyces incanus]|uniref:Uncharacterized protein n=1 Tax=Streptomyces incanus TaxID=887453 RepID=A0ABW0XY79_9ACTN